MKITFISVGKMKDPAFKALVREYESRIKRYATVESVDVREEKAPASVPLDAVLRKEAERIAGKLGKRSLAVALDERGKAFGSRALAGLISKEMEGGRAEVSFIVGGAWGLHEDVRKAAGLVLSLSPMTLPHEMARLVITEQVYRAYTIIKGEPYSH